MQHVLHRCAVGCCYTTAQGNKNLDTVMLVKTAFRLPLSKQALIVFVASIDVWKYFENNYFTKTRVIFPGSRETKVIWCIRLNIPIRTGTHFWNKFADQKEKSYQIYVRKLNINVSIKRQNLWKINSITLQGTYRNLNKNKFCVIYNP